MVVRENPNLGGYFCLMMKSKIICLYLFLRRRICWKAIDRDEPARYLNVSDIYDLALGCNTTDIMKKHNIPIGLYTTLIQFIQKSLISFAFPLLLTTGPWIANLMILK